MPLNPPTRKYLDELNALKAPPKRAQPIAALRKASIEKAALVKTKTTIATVIDRIIEGPGGELPVRIYHPIGAGPFPLIVYFHGGGWATNNLDTHDDLCRKLAQGTASVIVSVDYRLAPEAKFPAGLEDCIAATEWAAERAEEWNADPKRLIVAGDSSGGNFAAVIAARSKNSGNPAIAGQILFYPVTDHYDPGTQSYRSFREGYGLTGADMAWFWDLYLPDKTAANDPRASPLRASNFEGLPPALIITAEFDPLVDEGHAYALRLQQAGVPTTYSCYSGAIHGFLIQPALAADTDRAVQDSAQWLARLFASQ